MRSGPDLERRCADLEELLARERIARKLAQDEARVNSIALRVLAREVRAPLDGALEWARMLRREVLSSSGRDHALRVVERQIEGSMRLIDDLVVNVASTPPRPAQLQLDQLVMVAHAAAAPRLVERKLTCVLDLAATPLYADARRTERLLQRFLEAAIGLAREGSGLRIHLGPRGLTSAFETELELPLLPIESLDAISSPGGVAQPAFVNVFLLQQLAAARGARLELEQHERQGSLHLTLLHGQTEQTAPFSDHELRTPLQVLTLGVELLRTRVRDSQDDVPRAWVLERLDALEQAVDHLTAAVERLSASAHSAPLQSPPSGPQP